MTKHAELRQFAAMAMSGLIPSLNWDNDCGVYELGACYPDYVAKKAIEYAEALQTKLDELEPKCPHDHVSPVELPTGDGAILHFNRCIRCGVTV